MTATAATAVSVADAQQAHADALARVAEAADEHQGAAVTQRGLTDRLAAGDATVNPVEMVAAEAGVNRASLLLQAAQAAADHAATGIVEAGVAELIAEARAYIDSGAIAEADRLKRVAQEAVDAARAAEHAVSVRALDFGTRFRDAGLPVANPNLAGIRDPNDVGYRGYDVARFGPGAQVLGFTIGNSGAFVATSTWSPT